MKIGVIAPLYYPVPPKTYGGTEAVINFLVNGLQKKGHEVTLFCCKESKVLARMDQTFGKQLDILNIGTAEHRYCQKRMDYISGISKNFDLIHNHDGVLPTIYEKKFYCPMVTTWHTPFPKDVHAGSSEYQAITKTKLISISDSQRKYWPKANFIATVYNGTVDLDDYKFGKGGDYLVWIGRFSKSKGAVDAVDVALMSNHKLVMGAAMNSQKQVDYFNQFIKNKIDGKQIQYLGEVNLKQKVKLLPKAKAFLMPIHWEEPFGLVMIEALACGTPVIAYDRGSVREVIEDKKTGFIVKESDKKAMIDALNKIDTIDRRKCRERVEKHFSIEKMVAGYESVYQKIINKEL